MRFGIKIVAGVTTKKYNVSKYYALVSKPAELC